MSASKQVVFLPGEGIGPEVMAETRRVLTRLGERGAPVAIVDALYGAEAYRRTGKVVPDETMTAMRGADAILFGATGGPDYDAIPAAARREGNLLRIRRKLDLYANLRPIVAIPALAEASSLKNRVLEGVDFVIVRELSSGLYFGEPRGVERLPSGDRRGVNTHVYTSSEIRRVARYAFELARTRRRRVCSVDKANVMEAGALWREEVQALRDAEFADIELSHMLVDNCAMQLIRYPKQFDVVVTTNLFGDILTDEASMITGSIGMLPSASLGGKVGLFEPIHGSAPDIAGKGVANPLATILSIAMMLKYSFDLPTEAAWIEDAVERALSDGFRTGDIYREGPGVRRVGTKEMGEKVRTEIRKRA